MPIRRWFQTTSYSVSYAIGGPASWHGGRKEVWTRHHHRRRYLVYQQTSQWLMRSEADRVVRQERGLRWPRRRCPCLATGSSESAGLVRRLLSKAIARVDIHRRRHRSRPGRHRGRRRARDSDVSRSWAAGSHGTRAREQVWAATAMPGSSTRNVDRWKVASSSRPIRTASTRRELVRSRGYGSRDPINRSDNPATRS